MDFTPLSNDQLLQLIKAAMAEAVSRGVAIAKASQDIYVDAAEELRIKAEVQARAAQEEEKKKIEKIRKDAEREVTQQKREKEAQAIEGLWAAKSAAITALKEDPLFAKDEFFTLNIWSRGSDLRVYLEGKNWKITYYSTGNSYHPPKSIEGLNESHEARMVKYFQVLCDSWSGDLKVDTSALKYAPNPKKLEKYKAALQKEIVNV